MESRRTARRLEFACTGRAGHRMRIELDASMTSPSQTHFSFACDEGPNLGGEGSAPTPLHLFIGALTGCLMTQMRNFAARMDVRLDNLTVDVRANWQFTPVGNAYETRPDGIEVDVSIESPASEERIAALIAAARKGCFIEQTLSVPNVVTHRMMTPGGWKAL